jgi:hypothetical protein
MKQHIWMPAWRSGSCFAADLGASHPDSIHRRGTPSLLSAQGMDRLLSDIRTLLPLELDAEITMEANPGTFEVEKFRAYQDSGINRLSIGVQSFNNEFCKSSGGFIMVMKRGVRQNLQQSILITLILI